MLAAMRVTADLLKLRIGVAIAASAIAGLATGKGDTLTLGQILALALAVLGAAGAAGAYNHYFERDTDRQMARTSDRPFASGLLRPGLIWPASFLALLLASLVLAYAVAGGLATLFVFLGAFTYGVVYTVWLKRRSVWNIVIGGLAGSFAVLAGAAAVGAAFEPVPLVLALVLFLWTPPHFWSPAAAKKDDYAAAAVPMLPLVVPERLWTSVILGHTAALVVLSIVPVFLGAGPVYVLGAGLGGGFFLWRSWALFRAPSRGPAMANFGAPLLQHVLLISGVIGDAVLRGATWPA